MVNFIELHVGLRCIAPLFLGFLKFWNCHIVQLRLASFFVFFMLLCNNNNGSWMTVPTNEGSSSSDNDYKWVSCYNGYNLIVLERHLKQIESISYDTCVIRPHHRFLCKSTNKCASLSNILLLPSLRSTRSRWCVPCTRVSSRCFSSRIRFRTMLHCRCRRQLQSIQRR